MTSLADQVRATYDPEDYDEAWGRSLYSDQIIAISKERTRARQGVVVPEVLEAPLLKSDDGKVKKRRNTGAKQLSSKKARKKVKVLLPHRFSR